MTLTRRTLLRGMLGGAAVTVGLPWLERFAGRGAARAADVGDDGFPRRFGMFFWGNGMLPERFVPADTGTAWTPSEQLAPLAPFRDKLSVVSGMRVELPNLEPHWATACGFLTGGPIRFESGDWYFGGPTVDQVLAAAIGQDTRFPSLEVGTRPGGQTVCWSGPQSPLPIEHSPRALYARIFGGGFNLPGSRAVADPAIGLQRSVLDAVMDDVHRVQSRVGAADKVRLDKHFEGLRTLEKRLARLEEAPPSLAACAYPSEPAADYPDIEGRPQLQEINRAICDVLAMALACDQTRVFTNLFTRPLINVLFDGATAGHHQLTHDEPGEQPEVHAITLQCMEALAYQLQALDAIEEGDGTLLDHCVILGTSDVSHAKTHSQEDFPILLAGGGAGRLKTGVHYRSPASENASKVMLSVVRALGMDAASWGSEQGRVQDGLEAIEA